MYGILNWINDNYVTYLHNEDGSILLFDKLSEADEHAGGGENRRVVSLEGVRE